MIIINQSHKIGFITKRWQVIFFKKILAHYGRPIERERERESVFVGETEKESV